MSQLTEYRCTRTSLYQHDRIGRDDPGARQGHYRVACCRDHALLVMGADFPNDRHGFTVDAVKEADWPKAKCEHCGCDDNGNRPE